MDNIIDSPTYIPKPHIPKSPKRLLGHPVSQLFELFTTKHDSVDTVTMELRLREGMSHDSGSTHGALCCAIDCAARIAAQPLIGACALLEQELHFRVQSTATRFEVIARIDSATSQYAIYQCFIYALEQREHILIADSQGTLLKSDSPTRGINGT